MISQAVQHHMVTGPNQPPLMEQPDNVESVEGSVISYLETQIRVVTRNQGVRYFNVKVSEPW
jgi:hypothetical protein